MRRRSDEKGDERERESGALFARRNVLSGQVGEGRGGMMAEIANGSMQ